MRKVYAYTYEDCYNAAKQCKTVKEFDNRFPGEYQASYVHKFETGEVWLSKFTWLERSHRKRSYDVVKAAALLCKTKKEFSEKYGSEYNASLTHKTPDGIRWLDTFDWLETVRIKHTYEDCYNAAKQCKTLAEFQRNFSKYAFASERNKTEEGIKWIDTFDWLEKKPKKNHTYESCYNAAKQCKTVKEFYTRYKKEYEASCLRSNESGIRWIDTFDWLEKLADTSHKISNTKNITKAAIDFLKDPGAIHLDSRFFAIIWQATGCCPKLKKDFMDLAKTDADSVKRQKAINDSITDLENTPDEELYDVSDMMDELTDEEVEDKMMEEAVWDQPEKEDPEKVVTEKLIQLETIDRFMSNIPKCENYGEIVESIVNIISNDMICLWFDGNDEAVNRFLNS